MRSDFLKIPVNYKMTRYISKKQNKTKQNKLLLKGLLIILLIISNGYCTQQS